MPTDNLLGIWRKPYLSGTSTVAGHVYRQGTGETPSEFLNAIFAELATFYGTNPPDGSACLELQAWISGDVTYGPIQVCREEGESIDDFLDRAKREFNAALTLHPPD